MAIPTKKKKSLRNLLSGIENSSTITSEQEMYRKVPAAKQENIISTNSFESLSRPHPIATPAGVKMANVVSIVIMNLSCP